MDITYNVILGLHHGCICMQWIGWSVKKKEISALMNIMAKLEADYFTQMLPG